VLLVFQCTCASILIYALTLSLKQGRYYDPLLAEEEIEVQGRYYDPLLAEEEIEVQRG